jgi:hypothetical protein
MEEEEDTDDEEYTDWESDDDVDSVTDAWLSSMPDSFFDLVREESAVFAETKPPNHLCVGYCIPSEGILDVSILPVHFLRYPGDTIRHFLDFYTMHLSNVFPRPIEIMQLTYGPDQEYRVVLKTHWIRLIQRTWKRVFAERKRWVANLRTPYVPSLPWEPWARPWAEPSQIAK